MSLLQERIYKALNEKNAVQPYLSRKFFTSLESLGFYVLGDHFYKPIPNTEEIAQNYQDKPRSCHQINFNFDRAEQKIVGLLAKWGGKFFESASKYGYQEVNYYFKGLDAVFLYCFLREIQPKSLVEVGQGVSTLFRKFPIQYSIHRRNANLLFNKKINPYN